MSVGIFGFVVVTKEQECFRTEGPLDTPGRKQICARVGIDRLAYSAALQNLVKRPRHFSVH